MVETARTVTRRSDRARITRRSAHGPSVDCCRGARACPDNVAVFTGRGSLVAFAAGFDDAADGGVTAGPACLVGSVAGADQGQGLRAVVASAPQGRRLPGRSRRRLAAMRIGVARVTFQDYRILPFGDMPHRRFVPY